MDKLTLIIPIYEGVKEIKECLNSVLISKNIQEFEILLIDDNPENDIIHGVVQSFVNANKNIRALYNTENLGFSRSINKGIENCRGDVVILNSDTIVASHFIDKLYKLSKQNPKIGTISTLTNNGTILSVPKFNVATSFPENFDVEKYQKKIDKTLKLMKINDENLLCKIPTPVGHCMLITRNAIKRIGLFDNKNFGKGYGEENDFGERIERSGLKNYAALNVFVLHKGAISFKNSKSKFDLMREHSKVLNRKYPFYRLKVKLFLITNNPVKKMCRTMLGNKNEYSN